MVRLLLPLTIPETVKRLLETIAPGLSRGKRGDTFAANVCTSVPCCTVIPLWAPIVSVWAPLMETDPVAPLAKFKLRMVVSASRFVDSGVVLLLK